MEDHSSREIDDTWEIFCRVLLEKFEPMLEEDTPSISQRFFSNLCSTKNSFFYDENENTESQPAIQKSKTKIPLPIGRFVAMSIVAGVSIYSSWMYKDSSEEASLIINQQLNNLTNEWQNNTRVSLEFLTYGIDALTWLIYSCAMPTFAMMAIKINALIAGQAKYFLTRSDDEIELTGKLNPVFVASSLIVGGFSELPLVKVAWDSAKTVPTKINSLVAGAFDLSNYVYGGGEFISSLNSYLDIGLFRTTYDNTRSHYTWSKRKSLRHEADNMVMGIHDQVHKIFFEYSKNLRKSVVNNIQNAEESSELHEIFSSLSQLKREISNENLQEFLKHLAPDIYSTTSAITSEHLENNLRQSISFCEDVIENIISLLKNTPQFIKEVFVWLSLIAITLAMLINDIAAAYYAGFDFLKNPLGKKIIGIIAGICTGMSSIGLALFGFNEIKDFFLEEDSDPMKVIYPIRYILLSCIIAFMGIFSGGPTAVEGIKYVTRALIDLGYPAFADWMPQICEGLGFLGAGITDMPYAISLVSSLLTTCGEQLGDKNIKQLMSYMNGCQGVAFCLENMKIKHIDNLLKDNIIPYKEPDKNNSIIKIV